MHNLCLVVLSSNVQYFPMFSWACCCCCCCCTFAAVTNLQSRKCICSAPGSLLMGYLYLYLFLYLFSSAHTRTSVYGAFVFVLCLFSDAPFLCCDQFAVLEKHLHPDLCLWGIWHTSDATFQAIWHTFADKNTFDFGIVKTTSWSLIIFSSLIHPWGCN